MDTPTAIDRTLDLRHYGAILWRRKGLLILSTITVLCSALVALRFMPDEYESRVTLRFPEPQGLTHQMEQFAGGGGNAGRSYEVEEAQLSGMMAHIRSTPFLAEVGRQLKMTDDPAIRAATAAYRAKHPEQSTADFAMRLVVQRLQSCIRFAKAGTGIYEIVVVDYDPKTAQVLAQFISQLYVDDTKRVVNEEIQNTRDFSSEELIAQKEKLRIAEEELKRYQRRKIEAGLSSSSTVSEGNLRTAEWLRREIQQAADDAERDAGTWSSKLSQLGQKPSAGEALRTDAGVKDLVKRLRATLAGAIDDELAGAGASDAGVGEWLAEGTEGLRTDLINRLIDVASKRNPKANEEFCKALANSSFHGIDAEMQKSAADDLQRRVETFRQHASSQPSDELEEQGLQKEVDKIQALIQVFQEQMVSSGVRQALERSSLGLQPAILDPAKLPLSPSRPDRLKILLAALLLGPVLGAGFAFLSETTDATLRTLDDIQRVVPEPILCTTPLLSKLKPRHRGLRRHWVPAAVAGVLVLTAAFFFARMTVLDQIGVGRPTYVVSADSTLSQAKRGR